MSQSLSEEELSDERLSEDLLNTNLISGSFTSILLNRYEKFMYLKIFIDNDYFLKNLYIQHINKHNQNLINNINHIDAGFDLLAPESKSFRSLGVNKLDYKIICNARMVTRCNSYNTGFYMYPRSSISKSNLRLANNTGIIDAGYRGHLIGMFDVIYANEAIVNIYDRHLQICAPGLVPIIVHMVDSLSELGEETSRGDGGFGSTGL